MYDILIYGTNKFEFLSLCKNIFLGVPYQAVDFVSGPRINLPLIPTMSNAFCWVRKLVDVKSLILNTYAIILYLAPNFHFL